MESNADFGLILPLLFIASCVLLLLHYFPDAKQDPQEPPSIPQTIPYVGHLLGLIRHGTQYYAQVSSHHPLEIYTLRMPQGKTYVVNSLELVNCAQRNWKTLSLTPFVATFVKRLCQPSKTASEIVDSNLFGEDGPWGLCTDLHNAMYQTLAPGVDLDNLVRSAIQHVSESLNTLLTDQDEAVIDLYNWIHDTISLASTNAVYGPQNPYKTLQCRESFRAVGNNIAVLFANIATDWLAPRAHQGRTRIFEAFQAYYTNLGHEEGSSLVKSRYHATQQNNTPLEDTAKFELSSLFGLLSNMGPCTFWVTFDIFSRSRLLHDIRDEASVVVEESLKQDNNKIQSVDMGSMKEKCHLLSSAFQETLRMRSAGASIRQVRQDIQLADRYLLKKDSMVQMPLSFVHKNEDLWGKSASEYNPRRFMRTNFLSNEEQQASIKPGAFRPFGGGTALCPGRHFAATVITSVVAMLAIRFDIVPATAEGWKEPREAKNHGTTSILPPEQDLKVRVTRREGFEYCEWRYNVQGLNTRFRPGN